MGFTKLRELVSLSNIIAIADIYGFCAPLCTPTPSSIGLQWLTVSGISTVIGLCGPTFKDNRAPNLHAGGQNGH